MATGEREEIGLDSGKTTSLHVHHTLFTSRKVPIFFFFIFMKDIDIKRRRNFISSLSEFGRDPSSSTAGGFGYFLLKKWIGIIEVKTGRT